MDDDHEARGPVPGIDYALGMRDLGTYAEVVLFDAADYLAGRYETVWVHRLATLRSANSLFLAMLPHPGRWASWARMISILGADFVHRLIVAEADWARRAALRRAKERKRREDAERRRDEAPRRTWMWPVLRGAVPRIVASRGDHRVVLIELETVDEALRVWDWMRWQRQSIDEWLVIHDMEGAEALQGVILRRMVSEERRSSARGRPDQPDRPLRNWRPGTDEDEEGHP